MERGFEVWRSTGARVVEPWFKGILAGVYLLIGQAEKAEELIDDAIRVAGQTGELRSLAEIHRLRAEVLSARGDIAAAELALKAGMTLAQEQGASSMAARCALDLSSLLLAQGRKHEAKVTLASGLAGLQEGLHLSEFRQAADRLAEIT